MGIDISARWKGQKADEKNAQVTAAFSTADCDVGYAREAYFYAPSPAKYLFREAFESPSGMAAIPAKHCASVLRRHWIWPLSDSASCMGYSTSQTR